MSGAVLSPGGDYLLTTDVSSGLRLFEMPRGREILSFTGGPAVHGIAAAFSPDGGLLAAGGTDVAARAGVLHLFDLTTGQELRQLGGHVGGLRPGGLVGGLRAVAFGPDGKTLAALSVGIQGRATSEVCAWEAATGKTLWRVERPPPLLQGLAFAPDGRALACLDQAGGITLCDAATGQELRRLGGTVVSGSATTIVVSPDGRLLAVPVFEPTARRTHLYVYELASGTLRHEFIGHDGIVTALAFARDGKRLATGGSDTTVMRTGSTSARRRRRSCKNSPTPRRGR
jgi:WD40 repeat protein